MRNPEKLNLTQICEEFAPVFKLSAEGLAFLRVPHEIERRAVLLRKTQLVILTDALIDFLYVKREEFLAGPTPRVPAIPAPTIQHLPADDTEGGAI